MIGWVRVIAGNVLMALGEAILPSVDRHPSLWPNTQIDDEMRMSSD